MTELELHNYLLLHFPKENEKCEWKEFKSLKSAVAGRSGDDIISYISALANMKGGHLIIGVEDLTLNIIGIQNFEDYSIDNIKFRIIGNCTNLASEGFIITEYITTDTKKTIWIFTIPIHQYRLPVYAHKKAWQRIDDNLIEITQPRIDAILTEVKSTEDWTKEIILNATIDDLDVEAIDKARIEFVKRNTKYNTEINTWTNSKFLDKAKLTIKGKITKACFILLGKEEEEHFLDSVIKIRWNLKTLQNQDKDFEIFSIPLILAIDKVYAKIRNLKYRYLKSNTLFPDEVLRYDPYVIRESLNNAIAHQDYSRKARINVVEFEDDHLVFSNYGTFLPKSVEAVVLNDAPEEIYRNPFLVEAMKNLDMIETQGGGIRKIFNYQKQRFFPLPEYDLTNEKIKLTITGKVINEEFAKILIYNPDITLEDTIILDAVQKQKSIADSQLKYLKKNKFIEGRKGSLFLSLKVVKPSENENLKAEYIANRSFDDAHFKEMIIEYLKKFGATKRSTIDNLIIPKLSTALSDEKKKNKVTNYLSNLRMAEKIKKMPKYCWDIF